MLTKYSKNLNHVLYYELILCNIINNINIDDVFKFDNNYNAYIIYYNP